MSRTKKDIMTADILKKGHAHMDKKKEKAWRLCSECKGACIDLDGKECYKCKGEGIIYDN